ncbi:MAG: hypothetical protein KDD69_13710 [Bdellovibrionales bacterium]|nr:hypothetical protein [Bdellovibrionales bacterium]
MPKNQKRSLDTKRVLLIGLIVVAAFLVWDRARMQQQLSNPAYLKELANKLQADSDTGRHAQMILESRALAEQEFLQLQALIREADKSFATLKADVTEVGQLLNELLTTDKGRGIASDRDLLEQFQMATEGYSLDPDAIAANHQSLSALAVSIDAAISSRLFEKTPEPALASKVTELAEVAAQSCEQVKSVRTKIQAIAAAAPAASAGPDLATALTAFQQERAAREVEIAQVAAARVREEYHDKLAAQTAMHEREQQEAELANRAAIQAEQLKADKLAAEAEARRIAEAVEEGRIAEAKRVAERDAQLKAEAAEYEYQQALPEIEHYLSGFITPGHQQLKRKQWTYTDELKPLSLGEIRARACLRQDATGYMYFGATAGGNDRPGGALSGYSGGGAVPPELIPAIVKAQNLMLKFADKLVEHGKLLP